MVAKPHKSSQHKAASRSPAPSRLPKILNEDQVLQALRNVGAVSSGHFILSSGRHSDVYAEKFRALERPDLAVSLGASLADRFAGQQVDVVLSPALGAIVLGFATALALSRNGGARFIFAERDGGEMRLRRGFEVAPGERVLVIEDVVTTGGDSLRSVQALREAGLEVIHLIVVLDRGEGGEENIREAGIPYSPLFRIQDLELD